MKTPFLPFNSLLTPAVGIIKKSVCVKPLRYAAAMLYVALLSAMNPVAQTTLSPGSPLPNDFSSSNAPDNPGDNIRNGYYNKATPGFTAWVAEKSVVNNTSNRTSVNTMSGNQDISKFTGLPPNTAPTFTSGTTTTLNVCQNTTTTTINSLLTVSDVDLTQTETWSVTSAPTHGTLGGFNATASSGSASITPTGLTYTPTNGYSGSDAFTVQVSDGIATASMSVNVTVNGLPTITLGSNPAVCNGLTSANLTYSATTQTPTTYSIIWSAAGLTAGFTNVANASLPASPIILTVPGAGAAATYAGTITVANANGCSSTGTAFSTTIQSTPSISVNPIDKSNCAGASTTTFTVTAAGTGITYQWQLSTDGGTVYNNLTNTGIYTGSTTATLTLTQATYLTNGYMYKVVVTGTCGSPATSTAATLTVTPPPVISSITPLIAGPTDAVTITGTGFNITSSSNAVFFGSTQATINSVSATSLSVSVPGGSSYDRLSESNLGCKLMGFAQYSSLPTFTASATTASFATSTNTTAGTNPFDIVTGDLDGDGKPDIAVTNGQGGNWTVFRNTSTLGNITYASGTTYTEGPSGQSIYGLAIGDLNRDGKLDIVVADRDSSKIDVYINTSTVGSISFATRVKYSVTHAWQVKIADLDLDGRPDIIVAGDDQQKFSYFRNIYNGSGAFNSTSFATKVDVSVPSSQFLDAIAIGDIDGDGKQDVVVGAQTTNVDNLQVFRNTSSGPGSISFASAVTSSSAQYIYYLAVGDLDGNGKADIIAGNNGASYLTVLPNTSTSGSISFGTAIQLNALGGGYGVTLADFTGHGKPDIAYVNSDGSSTNVVSIYLNTSTPGNISFSSNTDFATSSSQNWGIVAADMDGDYKPDMVVANYQGTNFASYRNTIASTSTPTFTNSSPQAFAICQNAGATSINSLLTISDGQTGKTDTWTITLAPTHGTLSSFAGATHASGSSSIAPAGLTYTATTGYSGTDAFTVQVSDGAATASMIVNVTVTSLTVISTTANLTQDATIHSGNYTNGSCNIISTVQPSGANPVTGNVTAKVWIESSVPVYGGSPYVARHYEITPATNASTVTGTVTLYFLQSEFDAFNAAAGSILKLPTGSSDATGISNLRIGKYSGTSSDNTGFPGTYSSGAIVIDPADANVVWNVSGSRWEVSFDVVGFSGFIAQTSLFTLPVLWLSFTAEKLNDKVLLKWQTASEANSNRFTIEHSSDGRNYTAIGSVTAAGNSNSLLNYNFTDASPQKGNNFYRIKQTDNDGRSYYSETRIIVFNSSSKGFIIFVNPVTDGRLQVQFDNAAGIIIYDAAGRLVISRQINAGSQTINVGHLAPGVYLLHTGDQSQKFIVE